MCHFSLRPAGVQFDLDANMLITGLPLERGTPSVAPTQVSGTFVDGRKLVLVVMSWYGNCMMIRYVIGGVHQCRWWTVECDLSIFGLRSFQKQQVSAQMIGMELKSPCILYLDRVWSLYLFPPQKKNYRKAYILHIWITNVYCMLSCDTKDQLWRSIRMMNNS